MRKLKTDRGHNDLMNLVAAEMASRSFLPPPLDLPSGRKCAALRTKEGGDCSSGS